MNNQSKFLNKGISTSIGILIIVFCVLLVGGILAWQYLGPRGEVLKELPEAPELPKEPREEIKVPGEKPGGGPAYEIGDIKNAVLLNLSTYEEREIPELIGFPGPINYQISPFGDKIAFESDGLWIFDLEKRTKEKLKNPLDYGQLIIQSWSDDGSKLYFYTNIGRAEFKTAWSVNDTVYSINIISKEETMEVDYSEICNEPFSITPIGNGLFLARCGSNFFETEKITIKLYDAKNKILTDFLTGSLFDVSNFQFFPDFQKLIWYNDVQASLMLMDLKTKSKIKLNIEQNQGIYFSPDGRYFIYSYLNPNKPFGIHVYDLENNQARTILEEVRFVGWLEKDGKSRVLYYPHSPEVGLKEIKLYQIDIDGLDKKEIATFPTTGEYHLLYRGDIVLFLNLAITEM